MTGVHEFLRARTLPLATGFFFLVATFTIIASPLMMDTPRLGDDAMSHLWLGERMVGSESPSESRALRDITQAAADNADVPPTTRYWQTRILSRIGNNAHPLYHVMTGIFVQSKLSPHWAWAASETMTALVFALGSMVLLFALFGRAPASVALVAFAFFELPGDQGRNQYIPSLFALGLGMMLWGYLILKRDQVKHYLGALAAAVMMAVHPVALIYLAGAAAIRVLVPNVGWRDGVIRGAWFSGFAAFGVAVVIFIVQPLIWMPLGADFIAKDIAANIDPLAHIQINFPTAWQYVVFALAKNPVLFVLLAIGVIFFRREIFTPERLRVFGIVLFLAVLSLAFRRENAPADLFSRLLVLITILSAGFAGLTVCKLFITYRQWAVRLPVIMALLAGGVYSGRGYLDYFWLNMDHRPEIVDYGQVARQLQDLPEDTSIVFGETDIALPTMLLSGGNDFGALPIRMHPNTSTLLKAMNGKEPLVFALPIFRQLNSMAMGSVHTFHRRRYGIHGKSSDFVFLGVPKVNRPGLKYLRIENADAAQQLKLFTSFANALAGKVADTLDIPASFSGWLKFSGRVFSTSAEIGIGLPDADLWLTGVSLYEPKDLIRWPWRSGAVLAYHLREAPAKQLLGIRFLPDNLFKSHGLGSLINMVQGPEPVISDSGGIVFLKSFGFPQSR